MSNKIQAYLFDTQMKDQLQPEFWQRGPIEGIEPLLQPVVHAILQAQKEIKESLNDFPDELLWERPAGVASVAFHIQHLCGVLNRLFTYAKGEMLSDDQLLFLRNEGVQDPVIKSKFLLGQFYREIEKSIQQLGTTSAASLLEPREVGRKKIPSNVLGLLFHAAEHTQRHVGQVLVTARIVRVNKR